MKDRNGNSKGAAFVTYELAEHAEVAIQTLVNYTFPGSTRAINVCMADMSKGFATNAAAASGGGKTQGGSAQGCGVTITAGFAGCGGGCASTTCGGGICSGGGSGGDEGQGAFYSGSEDRGGAGYYGCTGDDANGAAGYGCNGEDTNGAASYGYGGDGGSGAGYYGCGSDNNSAGACYGGNDGSGDGYYGGGGCYVGCGGGAAPNPGYAGGGGAYGFGGGGMQGDGISPAVPNQNKAKPPPPTMPPPSHVISRHVARHAQGNQKGAVPGQPPPPTTPHPGFGFKGQPPPPAAAPGTKLFVGQLPFSRSESDLLTLFGSIGNVVDVQLHRDPRTGEKKGAAFVRYASPSDADLACATFDGHFFDGATRPISVSKAKNDEGGIRMPMLTMPTPSAPILPSKRPAQGQLVPTRRNPHMAQPIVELPRAASHVQSHMTHGDDEATKLFVGQLPFSKNEQEIDEVFSKYGHVAEVFLLRDAQGLKKGAAFVKFYQFADAVQALELDGYVFKGSTRAISVSIASQGGNSAKSRRLA